MMTNEKRLDMERGGKRDQMKERGEVWEWSS